MLEKKGLEGKVVTRGLEAVLEKALDGKVVSGREALWIGLDSVLRSGLEGVLQKMGLQACSSRLC